MLYQQSYEASLEAGQVWVQLIPIMWRELFVLFICGIKYANDTKEIDCELTCELTPTW